MRAFLKNLGILLLVALTLAVAGATLALPVLAATAWIAMPYASFVGVAWAAFWICFVLALAITMDERRR